MVSRDFTYSKTERKRERQVKRFALGLHELRQEQEKQGTKDIDYDQALALVEDAGLGAVGVKATTAKFEIDKDTNEKVKRTEKDPLNIGRRTVVEVDKKTGEEVEKERYYFTSASPAVTPDDFDELVEFLQNKQNKRKEFGERPGIGILGNGLACFIDADKPEEVEFLREWYEDVTGLPLPPATVSTPGTQKSNKKKNHKDGGHWYFALPDNVPEAFTSKHSWEITQNETGVHFDVRLGNMYVLAPPTERTDGLYVVSDDWVQWIKTGEALIGDMILPLAAIEAITATEDSAPKKTSSRKKATPNKGKDTGKKASTEGNTTKPKYKYRSLAEWKQGESWGDLLPRLSDIELNGRNDSVCGCPEFHYIAADSDKSGTLHNGGCSIAPEEDAIGIHSGTMKAEKGYTGEQVLRAKSSYVIDEIYNGDFSAFLTGEDITPSESNKREYQVERIYEELEGWQFVRGNLGQAFYKSTTSPVVLSLESAAERISKKLPLTYDDNLIVKALKRMEDYEQEPIDLQVRQASAREFIDKIDESRAYERNYVQLTSNTYALLDYKQATYSIVKGEDIEDDIALHTHDGLKPMECVTPDVIQNDIQGAYDAFWDSVNVQNEYERVLLLSSLVAHTAREIDTDVPLVVFEASKGSGKTTIARHIVELLDENTSAGGQVPKQEADITAQLANVYTICFDNVTSLSHDQQNILCLMSTGGEISARKLYTNNEVFTVDVRGLGVFTWTEQQRPRLRDDFLRRTVFIQSLDQVAYLGKKNERAIAGIYARNKATARGFLYELTAATYNNLYYGTPEDTYAGISLKRFSQVIQEVTKILEDWGVITPGLDVAAWYAMQLQQINTDTVGDLAGYLAVAGREGKGYQGTAGALLAAITKDAKQAGYNIAAFPTAKGLKTALQEDEAYLVNFFDMTIEYSKKYKAMHYTLEPKTVVNLEDYADYMEDATVTTA